MYLRRTRLHCAHGDGYTRTRMATEQGPQRRQTLTCMKPLLYVLERPSGRKQGRQRISQEIGQELAQPLRSFVPGFQNVGGHIGIVHVVLG